MRASLRFILAVAVLHVFSAGATFGADKRLITEKDLFNFIWIADPQLSPDGSRVAFVRISANEKKEGYDTSLWVVDRRWGRAASSDDW